ncbi:MAG: hypothetical protein Q7J10_02625 [Methanosarcinaceae archaeon]|nr:hypothetical protein [Methanosarcinaceae archaeon]
MIISISNIFVIILLIISGLITFAVLSNLIWKKSFHQIYDKLSKPNQTKEKKIQIINRLYDYIREFTNEEILIFNFRFNRFKSNHWYSITFVAILIIFISAIILLELPHSNLILIVFLIYIGYFFPIIYIRVRFNKLEYNKASFKDILYMLNLLFLKITLTVLIFCACILFILIMLNQLIKLEPNTSFFDVFAPYVNYGLLKSIRSSQLSLAGFFFTFAIGGTIIFSVTHKYMTHKKNIDEILLKDAEKYETWFKNNKYNVSFNLYDIIKIDSDKIKGYHQALFDLRSELNIDGYIKFIHPVKRYELFCLLVIGLYLLGILTLLLDEIFINLLFFIFILLSFLFLLLIYYIFRDYS